MGRVTINGTVAQFSCKRTIPKEREYLTENELKTLMEFQFKDPKNSYLRDIFVFASFTALSFVDIKELSNDQFVEVNGEKWIISKRHKTGVPFQVKLLDIPLQIIERYKAFQENNLVFPNLNYWSICKRMGKMIKECGITKKISFRHYNTYADIKRRKNESRTYFFDRAAERLNRRMMRDEEAERKRR